MRGKIFRTSDLNSLVSGVGVLRVHGLLEHWAPLGLSTCPDRTQQLQPAVFQAGWAGVPDDWRQLPEAEASLWCAVLAIRSEINLLLEKARADKALGASLEAKVGAFTDAQQALIVP